MRLISFLIALSFQLVSNMALALPEQASSNIGRGELLRVVSGLVVVLIIIAGLSWLVKRVNGANLGMRRGFQALATMSLGPKERMVLLQVGGRYLLLGVGVGSVNLLCDYGEQLPQDFEQGNKPSFSELLKSAVRRG
jgi:flagellar protein FliO/FliZ